MNITREWLRERKACYSDTEIAELIPEGGLTPAEVLDLPIPARDRIWVAARPEFLTRGQLVAFVQGCASRTAYTAAAAEAAARAAAAADYDAISVYIYATAAACVAATEREDQITHLKQLIGS